MEDDSCFHYFNPEAQEEYNWYVNNWSAAFSDMLHAVLDKESSSSSSSFYQTIQ
jgi:uncharacterized protein with ParB-like and HNH nuclease domain